MSKIIALDTFPEGHKPKNMALNSSHIDEWLWVLVSAKQQTGGSQDYLVCLHLLAIITDQSDTRKVILTLGAKMAKIWGRKHDYDMIWFEVTRNIRSCKKLSNNKGSFVLLNVSFLCE